MSKTEAAQLLDTLTNVAAGLGTDKDKRSYSRFTFSDVSDAELESMYLSDWLSAAIVDIPVNDMTRKWREYSAPSLDDDQIKQLKAAEQRILLRPKVVDAEKWARLYGGAVILMGVDGAGKPDEPLELDKVQPGSLKFLRVLDKQFIQPGEINTSDPLSESFLMPQTYRVGGKDIHESRVLRFDGRRLPQKLMQTNNYWGASHLRTAYEQIVDAQSANHTIASLLFESKLDVISIPRLTELLSSSEGSDSLIARFRLADIIKSVNNSLLLDSQEKFERKAANFGGVSDVQKNFMLVSSAAARIPATRLYGQAAQGLNASGEGQKDDYYDMISSAQNDDLRPPLDKFDEVFLRSELGEVPDDWSYEFPPLDQLDELEQAQVDKTNAETAAIYTGIGAIDQTVVVKQLQDQGTYEAIDDEYVALLEGISQTTAVGEGLD
jgi:phage-related protein (TIGR01555 family)